MPDTEIVHPVPAGEIAPWLASMVTTFLGDPADAVADAPARAVSWRADRAWGARSDGRWVATLRTEPRAITVPGALAGAADLVADALTNVTVAATHRRLGLLRAMLTESLQAARDNGEAVSALIAAEWPIYGRFGYAAASDSARYTVRTREPGARIGTEPTGSLRQVDSHELATLGPAIFDAARVQRGGQIDRPSYWWDRSLGRNGFRPASKAPLVHVVHQGPDGPDGYVSWSSVGDWTLTGDLGQVKVTDLIAANDDAYASLWHYLLGIDVIDRIHLDDRPVDEPLHWLLADARAMRQTHRVDWMWLRILDPRAALSARRYSVEGSVVLEIVDPDGAGFAAGRYLLEGGPDGAQCTPTTRSAQLAVHQRALAASYLGATSLTSQRPSGLIDELSPGALTRADSMLATSLAPWCATGF